MPPSRCTATDCLVLNAAVGFLRLIILLLYFELYDLQNGRYIGHHALCFFAMFPGKSGNLTPQHYTQVVRMLLMLADSNVDQSDSSWLESMLCPLASVLNTIGSHVYMPVTTADRALMLLTVLLREVKSTDSEFLPPTDDNDINR